MGSEIISIENVSVNVSSSGRLRNVFIDVSKGEQIAVLGTKGSGVLKLAEMLMGKESAYEGEVIVNGKKYAPGNEFSANREGVFFVSYRSRLIGDMSISENLFLTRPNRRIFTLINEKAIELETDELLKTYGFDMTGQTKVKELTVLEQLMLEIVRAYLNNARIIILYDVLRNYDEKGVSQFKRIIDMLSEAGIAFIFLGHNYYDSMQKLDRIYVLTDGCITKVLYSPVDEEVLSGYRVDNQYMKGVEISQTGEMSNVKSVYKATDLSGGRVSELSFDLMQSEVLGILDREYYCGKGLSRMLFGDLPISKGHLSVDGERVFKPSSARMVKMGVALISHATESTLFGDLSVKDNISISILKKSHSVSGIVKQRLLDYAFEEMKGLFGDMNGSDPVRQLPHDDEIRIQLAKCMYANPRVIIVENPILNSDVVQGKIIHDFIKTMVGKGSSAIIVSSSSEYLENISDRVIVLEKGCMVVE